MPSFRKMQKLFVNGLLLTAALSGQFVEAGVRAPSEGMRGEEASPQTVSSTAATSLSVSALFKGSDDDALQEPSIKIESPFIRTNMDIGMRVGDAYVLGHDGRLTPTILQGFVSKGYRLLSLIAQEKVDEIEHTATILQLLEPADNQSWSAWAWSWVKKQTVSEESLQKKQPYFESLLSILWALYDHSFKTNQGFTRGSFSLLDLEGRFEAFLTGLLKKLSEAEALDDVPYVSFNVLWSKNPCVYIRPSSHYQNESSFYVNKQFGIDLYDPQSTILSLFPFGMQHLLCGMMKNTEGVKKIFLKTEPHGLGDFYSIMRHTMAFLGYAESDALGMRREKDVPGGIARAAHHFAQLFTDAFCPDTDEESLDDGDDEVDEEVGGDDLKESTEKDAFENDQLPDSLRWYIAGNPRGAYEVFFTKAENIDIATLWSWAQYDFSVPCGEDEALRANVLAAQQDLKNQILQVYPEENELPYRTGNEVIVHLRDFAILPFKRFRIQSARSGVSSD